MPKEKTKENLEFAIRPMEVADLEAVLLMQKELGEQNWQRQHFVQELKQSQSSLCLVAQQNNGTIVGYMIAQIQYDQAELLSLMVTGTCQRRGVATALLGKLLAQAPQMAIAPLQNIFLEVRANNLKAQNFYQKSGFRPCGLRPNYYGPSQDAVLMELPYVL